MSITFSWPEESERSKDALKRPDGVDQFRVLPGQEVDLDEYPTRYEGEITKKKALKELEQSKKRLNLLQQLLYATEKRSLLVVLQGMDTSGKDGTIKHVMDAFNPQGCQVSGFKAPTSEELRHDFLWRVHKVVPARGMVGIFNRSHYEDVLIQRVEEMVPKAVWRGRYESIREFEESITEAGTIVVKFFLHISPDEQKKRLEDRLADPTAQWKFKVGDLRVRAKWDEYQTAYEDALTECSTEIAPWYIVPADRKWYRNLVVSRVLEKTLSDLDLEWPPLEEEAKGIEIE